MLQINSLWNIVVIMWGTLPPCTKNTGYPLPPAPTEV